MINIMSSDGKTVVRQIKESRGDIIRRMPDEKLAEGIQTIIHVCTSCERYNTVRTRGCILRQNFSKDFMFLPCVDKQGLIEWLQQEEK